MKKKDLKDVKPKSKNGKNSKKESYMAGLKSELKKVVWPNKKEVLKYTAATLIFCVIVMLFFQALDFGLSVIKGAIN